MDPVKKILGKKKTKWHLVGEFYCIESMHEVIARLKKRNIKYKIKKMRDYTMLFADKPQPKDWKGHEL